LTLIKEGGGIKSWKNRWFVLENDTLTYYTKKGGEKKGDISIRSCGTTRAEDYKDKAHCFKVVTSARTYHFCAPDQQQMKEWIEAINAARRNLGVLDDSSSSTSLSRSERAVATRGVSVKADDFESLKVIGSGGFGKVLQVRYKPTGQIFAMKVLNKKEIVEADEVHKTKTEKSILMKLDHPFLVKLHFAFQTPAKVIFVMDYVNGGELFFHLSKQQRGFNPDRVLFYGAEIALGIEYLHRKGIIYRDLKPENLLISKDGHICMTDFGISKEGLNAKDARTATFCGTPEYLAPEILEGVEYGKEVDWWSFGTLMYEMLVGVPPFYSEDVQVMYRKIMNDPVDVNAIRERDPSAVDLICSLLERDIKKRLADPEQIKKHPYFSSIDWEKLYRKEITPPFIPPVKDEEDTSQIDPTFTRQKAALSVSDGDELSKTAQERFMDFTYVARMEDLSIE
jgi:RAC serine/threonine-protein kinase